MNRSFLGKILAALLSVFISSFPQFVKKLFKKIPDELKTKLSIIIEVVANIEKFVYSPGVDLITEVIPGHADDEFKEWLRKNLSDILSKAYHFIENVPENPDAKKALLHSLATLLTKELTGSSFGQAAITIEVAYQNHGKVLHEEPQA